MTTSNDFSRWDVAHSPAEGQPLPDSQTLDTSNQKPSEHPVQILPREVEAILAFGEREGWNIAYMGQAPYPTRTVRLEKWKVVPAYQDPTELPRKAVDRMRRLEAAGFRFRGYVIAHELESFASMADQPRGVGANMERHLATTKNVSQSVVKASGTVLPFLLGAVVLVGGVLVSLAVTLISVIAGSLAAIDPILIAVTREESAWVSIYKWDE